MATLSAKELTAIEDQLGMEQVLVKKLRSYAELTTDPQLKMKCTQLADTHQRHYSRLLNHLN